MDWRDLRIALAVERHGSLAAAGVALKIDPTTVGRRVTALESAIGVALFLRSPEGWQPTDAGRRVVDHAAHMAEHARAVRDDVDLVSARVEGTVRLTLLDDLARWWLAPHVPALRQRHPQLCLQLVCTEKVVELTRERDDLAARLDPPAVRRGMETDPAIGARFACVQPEPSPKQVGQLVPITSHRMSDVDSHLGEAEPPRRAIRQAHVHVAGGQLNRPTEPGVLVRRLGSLQIGLYAARSYLRRVPIPALPWSGEVDVVALGSVAHPVPELRWVRSLLPRARVVVAGNSVPAAHALVSAGVGVGVLATTSADTEGLVRLDSGVPGFERPLWRVVPEGLAGAPRVKAVLDWLDGLPVGDGGG